MSDLEKFEPTIPATIMPDAPARGVQGALSALETEARVVSAAVPVVRAVIEGGLAPASYYQTKQGPKPLEQAVSEGVAAVVYGASLGYGAVQSLNNVFVVHGTPAIYARSAVALVLQHGHEVWTESESPVEVVVCGRRKGSTTVERAVWSIERAKQAGYTSNKKYQTDPQAMLYAKAAMQVCRRIAPDVLSGIAYSAEEMQLEQPPVQATATRVSTRGAAGLRAALEAAPVEPEAVEAEAATGSPVEVWLESVQQATSRAELRELAEGAKQAGFTEEELTAIGQAVNTRWAEVGPQ